ncbi:MAG TPA: hypothetical protein VL128_01885 [Candidatus Eisenbacteria bacterium]|nr:hypothetical protein [Candidatus Eisenbacteria bacterium]
MKAIHGTVLGLCGLLSLCATPTVIAQQQNWTNYVRIGAYGLTPGNAEVIVREAERDGVFGIEVDNDIPGRYESLLDPTEKLNAIRAVAEAAHKAHNRAFVYIAGTECITANADHSAHSVVKDHPDWLQRKISGEPAVFTSGAAFWIRPGDEDVWVTPYAKDWRKLYMARVRQIAGTGIDGIYVDIPYWMTHFEGWEKSWASFDDATVAAFLAKTGLDARKDLKLGDFEDANFRKWVDFRIETMTEFVEEIRTQARSVNPDIAVIPEIYPGIEQEAVVVGADVYQMYGVVDAIAHEYEFGNGEHMAASRTQLDWFLYQAGMLSFRAFAQGKATWLLNYSWDGNKGVDKREAMKNLAMSEVMAGTNFWDAQGHEMARSNDPATRREIFAWIRDNEKTLYAPRTPMNPIGVYFSPKSRDYDWKDFLPEYRGWLVMLLQAHQEFQVVTPRTLSAFRGETLIMPSVSSMDDMERQNLERYVSSGGMLLITGKNATGIAPSSKVKFMDTQPGASYFEELEKDFLAAPSKMPKGLLESIKAGNKITLTAPTTMAANFAEVSGAPHIYLANFGGLVPNKVADPTPAKPVRVSIPEKMGSTIVFLPFLGKKQTIQGTRNGERMEFLLPAVERGAVVWVSKP